MFFNIFIHTLDRRVLLPCSNVANSINDSILKNLHMLEKHIKLGHWEKKEEMGDFWSDGVCLFMSLLYMMGSHSPEDS